MDKIVMELKNDTVAFDKIVVKNWIKIESVLNEQHDFIAYHMARWAFATQEVVIRWVNTNLNLEVHSENDW